MRRSAGLALRVGAALTLAGSLAACRTLPAPELIAVAGEEALIAEWVRGVAERAAQRRSLRAFGSLRISGPDGSGRAKQVIVAQRPDLLRLESLSLLGQTQALLVTDGKAYGFFEGGAIERGPAAHSLLRERVGLDVGTAEAVALLLAAPELPSGPPKRVYAYSGAAQSGERLAIFDAAALHFSPTGELWSIERLDGAGRVRWTARYTRWRDVAGGRYPFDMQLDFPATEVRLEIRLNDVELNATLPSSLFSLPDPQD